MSKKEKDKKKDKKKQKKIDILNNIKKAEKCKSSCCEKFKKSEDKRCKRCPMFDLFKNAS